MNEMRALIVSETRLLIRDPMTWFIAIALPTVVLLVIGSVFPLDPDPALGGYRWIDLFAPSLVVITTATLGIQALPIRLATYREKGILRRLSTTPVHPARLLVAQLVVYSATAVIALVLLVIAGHLALQIALPVNLIGYVAAFALGMAALFAIGLLLAAVVPTGGKATGVGIPIFFVVMFLGGVYLPRYLLPEILQTIGDFTPPGVQGLQDAWLGAAPEALPLIGMAAITVLAGALAVRVFRWE